MNNIFVRSNTAKGTVTAYFPSQPGNLSIADSEGTIVAAPVISQSTTAGESVIVLDAGKLAMWTPEDPVL